MIFLLCKVFFHSQYLANFNLQNNPVAPNTFYVSLFSKPLPLKFWKNNELMFRFFACKHTLELLFELKMP